MSDKLTHSVIHNVQPSLLPEKPQPEVAQTLAERSGKIGFDNEPEVVLAPIARRVASIRKPVTRLLPSAARRTIKR
jgi:hypothetical protein